MKRLIFIFCFAFFIAQVSAKENITIIYAFGIGDPMANYNRALVTEANKLQDKYNFLFDVKPGAGNAIAVQYVGKTPNTILSTSGAFFVRPIFYPNESYNIAAFRGIMPQCNDVMSIASSKYKTMKDIPTNKPLLIAITGLGVVSHLIAVKFTEKYPNVQLIPYKSPTEGIAALLGGQVDFVVGYVGDQVRLSTDKTPIHILGVTGKTTINGHPTLASVGISKLLEESDNPNQLFVPTNWSNEKYKEIRAILVKASNTKTVRDAYATNYCKSLDQMADKDIQPWYENQEKHWKKLSNGVKIQE